MRELNLETFDNHPLIVKSVIEDCKEGNVPHIQSVISEEITMCFIFDNRHLLKEMDRYEEALLYAYQATRTNNSHWSMDVLRFLFELADIEKLRTAGDPIPDQETFTLYRGVSGQGRKRRVNSFSWTDLPGTAAWFASRFCNLPDPAVFTITVPNEIVMACCRDRNENEYLLRLPLPVKPKRLKEMPVPILNKTNIK